MQSKSVISEACLLCSAGNGTHIHFYGCKGVLACAALQALDATAALEYLSSLRMVLRIPHPCRVKPAHTARPTAKRDRQFRICCRLSLGTVAPELHRVCVQPPSHGKISLEADFTWKGNQELQLIIKPLPRRMGPATLFLHLLSGIVRLRVRLLALLAIMPADHVMWLSQAYVMHLVLSLACAEWEVTQCWWTRSNAAC